MRKLVVKYQKEWPCSEKNIAHSESTCCNFIIQTRLQPMNMNNSAISCQQHGLKGDYLPFLNFIIVLEIFSILWTTKSEKVTKVELFQKLSFYSKKADNHPIRHIKRRLLTRCTEQNSTCSFDFWKKCFFGRFLAVPACNKKRENDTKKETNKHIFYQKFIASSQVSNVLFKNFNWWGSI